jgi:CubicO group peptidase (beta-lactamase class C family)
MISRLGATLLSAACVAAAGAPTHAQDAVGRPMNPPVAGSVAGSVVADPAGETVAAGVDLRGALVDSIFAAMDGLDRPGAAVAVVHDGRIVLERGYGSAQLEYGVPITPATVFHVASVSKQFATFAVVLLAQDGRLSLDDDIRTHLPELHDFGSPITVRHLIHHTSGIRDQWELLMMAGWRLDDVITRDHIMSMMRRQRELNFEPGSEHLYSNMGYSLLAEIVERVSGRSFGEFLDTRVFQPLGMGSTHVHDDHERIVPGRAYSYRPVQGGNGWRTAVLSYANQGATSLFTTAGDLARWIVNFETGQVGGADAIHQMRQRGVLTGGDTIPYAFAVTRSQHRGRTTWGHSGADAGFRSMAIHFPDERLGVIVLSNAANANPGRLALAVADVYLGETAPLVQGTPQQPAPVQRPQWRPAPDQLGAFAGDFYSPELATVYTIEVRGDSLFITHARLGQSLAAAAGDTDSFRAGGRLLRFERDEAGSVTGFRITQSRVRNVMFVKLPEGTLPPL